MPTPLPTLPPPDLQPPDTHGHLMRGERSGHGPPRSRAQIASEHPPQIPAPVVTHANALPDGHRRRVGARWGGWASDAPRGPHDTHPNASPVGIGPRPLAGGTT
uniref:Uncharacterized protein n=1 Tax=Human herpesvirus 1 TaxID=10298 RepID=A0A8E4LH45_HHV1|nr:hypothetical protein HSV-1_85 [Human alphaherpesvirus 1]